MVEYPAGLLMYLFPFPFSGYRISSVNITLNLKAILQEADSVVVTWWELNQTSDTPLMRVSNYNGETFGFMLMLAIIGEAAEAEDEG
jgi:hypothetical protein